MHKAQSLLFVVFLLILVATLAAALSSSLKSEYLIQSHQEYGLKAFYLASAGIERAKIEATNGSITSPSWSLAQSLAGGQYQYFIEDIGSGRRLLRSQGRVFDNSGTLASEQEIEVKVEGMGDADPSNDLTIPWTWRQT